MTHPLNGEAELRTGNSFSQSTSRLFYLDNLRALAMLAGIVFHVALAYSPLMHNVWFLADKENSVVIDWFAYLLHLFRMPLFFLISGFFAMMLIEKRQLSGFLKNRAKRVLLPFVIFLPLVIISVVASFGWAISNVQNQPPMLQLIAWSANNPELPQQPFSTIHLWFLYNLFMFCIVTAVLSKLGFFRSKLMARMFTAKSLLFVLPLIMVPALVTQTAPHPAPDKIYPELWSFGFYGMFFLIGNILYTNQKLLTQLVEYKLWMLGIGILAYIVFYLLLPETITIESVMQFSANKTFDWSHVLIGLLESIVAIYITFACLVFGKRYFNQHSPTFRLIADSSYWVYLVHIPLLFSIQFVMLDIELNMWLKFLLSNVLVLSIGFVSYLLLVRRTPLGRLLNGKTKVVPNDDIPNQAENQTN